MIDVVDYSTVISFFLYCMLYGTLVGCAISMFVNMTVWKD